MAQGRDSSKSPSTSYRETFRRHRKLFCLPVVLGALAAAFVQFGTGKPYTSTASLWIDTPPPAPSSIAAGSGTGNPPAAAEQGILSELLATKSFVTSVAESSLLGRSVSGPHPRQQDLAALGNGHVVQTVWGGQLLQLSYSAPSPAMAQSVLGAVITQLRNYTARLTTHHDLATVAYDRAQVKLAENLVATARSNVSAYQARHPGVSQTDPNYVALVSAENNAMTQLAQANTALGQVTQAGNPDAWSIQVLDPPSQGSATPTRKRTIVEVIFAGALGGAVVSFLAVMALTPARKEAWEDELPIGGPPAPHAPSPGPFPDGSPGAPAPGPGAVPGAALLGQPRLSLGERRFQLRTTAAPPERR